MRLDPKRRGDLINKFLELQIQVLNIAEEIGSKRMEARVSDTSEAFWYRLSKDKNLKPSIDVEAEMDDNSDDSAGYEMEASE